MHKKLEADLISLAHKILKTKGKSDVFTLQRLSKDIYEKLSLLAFVEEYVNHTPGIKETKEELLEKVAQGLEKKLKDEEQATLDKVLPETTIVHDLIEETIEEVTNDEAENSSEKPTIQKLEELSKKESIEQPFDELETILFSEPEVSEKQTHSQAADDKKETTNVKPKTELDKELQDTISVDVMADMFENAQPKSLNQKLATNLQIGLNDRIAFVKHLFNGNQEDYNRVVSQLNTLKTEKEAIKFINNMVKPDYDWSNQEELETRFLEIVARKFI